jgi:hypothetical protein
MPYASRIGPLALALALAAPAPARAQRDTTVVAGPQYARGWLYRQLFGTEYRRLWTVPLWVPLLDLRGYAGGLTPLSSGGGYQTKSLWLRGADGLRYGFRSVDKLLDVPEDLEGTFLENIAQDQTRAQHPGAPAVAAALQAAAGVLHTEQELVVIPDDPALDTFRLRFAGVLGFFERRAEVEPGLPGFAGAIEIISSRRLIPRVFDGPANRVDGRAFLAARLMDIYLGDWDRHRGQWTWARFGEGQPVVWEPIPEDRDHAFVRFDGLMLGVGRRTAAPQLVQFGERYANVVGQTWNGRDIDRWFLNGLDRAAWDSVAAALQARLTDSVIDAAVRRLPDAWRELDGERLARALAARRDRLDEAATRFYRVLSRELDLHATRAAELVTIERLDGGRLAVRFAAQEPARTEPYLARTLDPRETREVRLYLYGGADRVIVRGDGDAAITVRIIGGGATELMDSSRAGGVRLYATGGDRVLGPGRVKVDARAYNPPRGPREDVPPPRDWGRRTWPATWVSFGPDIGVFAGTGGIYTRYGFRKLPYAWSWRWRGGWATAANTGRVAADATIYRANSRLHGELSGLVSGIEVLRWHGLGNETLRDRPDAYYRVTQHRYAFGAGLVAPVGQRAEVAVGPAVLFNDTDERPGRIIADSMPYGAGDFGQVGLRGELRLDTRDLPGEPTRGATLSLGGAGYPAVWDVRTAFGEVHGQATAYLTARIPLRTTLALRAGAKRVLGTYPFSEAAFIGDAATARLGRQNRYGGDLAAWGNAELRVRLGRVFVLVPSDLGVFALGDAGRVWVEGESSDRWHSAVGGGLWLSLVRPGNVLSLTVAKSPERTALYLAAGFAY